MRNVMAFISVVSVMLNSAVVIGAQSYPNKPVRIIAAEPGGGGELLARIIAPPISGLLGQPVIIENRGNTLTNGILAAATPDGYTIGVTGSALWVTPFLEKTTYDPIRDFAPITSLAKQPTIVIVHPSVPADSIKELIALTKAKPGTLNYASGPVGGSSHLAMELFKFMAGINIVRIPYKGVGSALTAVIAGESQVMITTPGAAMPQVRSGKLRALAVTSAEPSALVPGLTTMSAAGVPGYASENINGILAPARTPTAVINRLNQETVRVLSTPEVKEKIFNCGLEVATSSPAQFAAIIKSEMARWGKLISDARIQPD